MDFSSETSNPSRPRHRSPWRQSMAFTIGFLLFGSMLMAGCRDAPVSGASGSDSLEGTRTDSRMALESAPNNRGQGCKQGLFVAMAWECLHTGAQEGKADPMVGHP